MKWFLLILAVASIACSLSTIPATIAPIAVPSTPIAAATANPGEVYTLSGFVYVRSCESLSCSVIGVLAAGRAATAWCTAGSEWCKVNDGYVKKACLIGKCGRK